MPVRHISATTLPAVPGPVHEQALVAMRGPVPGLPIIRPAVAGPTLKATLLKCVTRVCAFNSKERFPRLFPDGLGLILW
jgi:hypothetical protein